MIAMITPINARLSCCRIVNRPEGIILAAMAGTNSGLITLAHCDTASAAEVAALLASRCGHPPLHGIIYSGGVLADALIPSQTASGMRYVLIIIPIDPCRPTCSTVMTYLCILSPSNSPLLSFIYFTLPPALSLI